MCNSSKLTFTIATVASSPPFPASPSFVQNACRTVTLQHLWRTTAVQTARTWRQTEKSQREASRRLSAYAEAEATAHGRLDSAEFGNKLGARVARVRRAWGELEGFYNDTASERATLATVMDGKANGIQIDAAGVKLNPPLTVVHAAENTPGLSDCYDGGRLSFTGFFQLWTVALGVLKEKLDDRPADVGKKAEQVSTLHHRHKKHLSSALELLSRLSDSVLTDLDGSIKLLSRSVDDLQAKAGLSVKWASRSERMASKLATGRGVGSGDRGGDGDEDGNDAAATSVGHAMVPSFSTPTTADSPPSVDTAVANGGSLSLSAGAALSVKSTDDFLRELVGSDAALEAAPAPSSPSREVRVAPSGSLSSPYSPLRNQSVVSGAGASMVSVAVKRGASSWLADVSGQGYGEGAATAAVEQILRPPPPLARGAASGASAPSPAGQPPSTQSSMTPTRVSAVDMLTSRPAECAAVDPPTALDVTHTFSSQDLHQLLTRHARSPPKSTAQPQQPSSGAWSRDGLDTSTMSARSTGSMAGSAARSPRVVGGLSFTPTPGGSQRQPAASLQQPSAPLLHGVAGSFSALAMGEPRPASPALSAASTTVADQRAIDCGALNARVGSGAVVLTTLSLPSGFASPMKAANGADVNRTPSASTAAAAATECEIDVLKRRLNQVKLRTPQGSRAAPARAMPTRARMTPTQQHWHIAQGGVTPVAAPSRLARPASTPAPALSGIATPRGFDLSNIKARLDRQKEIYSPQASREIGDALASWKIEDPFGNIDLDTFENAVEDVAMDARLDGLLSDCLRQ